MPTLKIGDVAPDFMLLDDSDRNTSLAIFKSRKLVLYFYPKDDTPGCTMEAKDFSALAQQFAANNVTVLGISTDSTDCHRKFKNKHSLNVLLLSDIGSRMAESYGVWVEKSMFGKKYMGIARTTFLLNSEHVIVHIWHDVKALGHAKEVLSFISAR